MAEEPVSKDNVWIWRILVFCSLIGSLWRLGTCRSNNTINTRETKKEVTLQEYSSPIGTCKYTGPVDQNGLPNGFGEASFSDGRYYKGNFEHGNLAGAQAYFRYGNGDVFEGEFRDNSFYFGVYTIAQDGSSFHGYYKNGQPDKGVWQDKNGRIIQ